MTKDVIDAIKERTSIRRFKPDPVPQATIGRLLDAARLAPSAGNMQPWFFVVVMNEDLRRQLAKAARQPFIAEAPVCIVVCAEPERSASRYGRRGRELYCIQDTAAAIENILLAATGYGLGACWVGAFDEEEAARILELEPGLRPVALIPIGYPDQERKAVPRRPLDEVVRVIN
ncbi:MAG TPA: nitroreductase family protein [Syntrophomonadaceae bacterium]|nr:nitroreductase family protein [Syntrophomonadaceae bacterium]